MAKCITIKVPLHVHTPKRYLINLNGYRNWHYYVKNATKKAYKDGLYEQLHNIKLSTPLKIEYTLHRKDNRKGDRGNPLSVHDKYFLDALVDYGCIPDDTDEYISSQHFYTGEIDKENPRVEIKIYEGPYKANSKKKCL
jgi:Holliday junction resolvase RusA-like endonuclease